MLRSIIIAALAACGVSPTPVTTDPPEDPGEYEPSEPVVKPTDSHWCCHSVDPKTQSGEGCNAFSGAIELINACAQYLYCEGNVTKQDGKVTCTS